MTDDDRDARADGAAKTAVRRFADLKIEAVTWVGRDTDRPYRLITFGSWDLLDKITVAVHGDTSDDDLLSIARTRVHEFASRIAAESQDWAFEDPLANFGDPPDTV